MANKINWIDNERKTFFKGKKGVPKKDGSGGGMRLNKGRGGCSLEEQEKFGRGKNKFTPEKSLKLAGNLLLMSSGIYAGTKLLKEI